MAKLTKESLVRKVVLLARFLFLNGAFQCPPEHGICLPPKQKEVCLGLQWWVVMGHTSTAVLCIELERTVSECHFGFVTSLRSFILFSKLEGGSYTTPQMSWVYWGLFAFPVQGHFCKMSRTNTNSLCVSKTTTYLCERNFYWCYSENFVPVHAKLSTSEGALETLIVFKVKRNCWIEQPRH